MKVKFPAWIILRMSQRLVQHSGQIAVWIKAFHRGRFNQTEDNDTALRAAEHFEIRNSSGKY